MIACKSIQDRITDSNLLPVLKSSLGDPSYAFLEAIEFGYAKGLEVASLYDNSGQYSRAIVSSMLPEILSLLGYSDEVEIQDQLTDALPEGFLTAGATQAFSVILENILRNHDRLPHEVPVIIFPIPTYGLFLEIAKNMGFSVVGIERDPTSRWTFDSSLLAEGIQVIQSGGTAKVVAYFDSCPNNPTGIIRTDQEATTIATVLQAYPDIGIIDDAVYFGTEYSSKVRGHGLFGKKTLLPEQTYTIFGGSKIGLTALRCGLIVTANQARGGLSDRDLRHNGHRGISEILLNRCYFPSPISSHALQFAYSNEPSHKQKRNRYFTASAQRYRSMGLFMKGLINGFASLSVTSQERTYYYQLIAELLHIGMREAKERYATEIEGVQVVTEPEAGFFHLIDFSRLQGRYYSKTFFRDAWRPDSIVCPLSLDSLLQHKPKNTFKLLKQRRPVENPSNLLHRQNFDNIIQITTPYHVASLLAGFQFSQCTPNFLGYDELNGSKFLFRFTFAIEPEDIIRTADRIKIAVRKTSATVGDVPHYLYSSEVELQQAPSKTKYLP